VSKEIWSELQSPQSDASADAPSAREPRRPHLTARTLVRGDTEPATAATHPRRQPSHHTSTASAVDIEQLIVERTESVRAPPLDTRTYQHVTLANGLRALLVHDAEADRAAAAIEVLRRELVSSRPPRPRPPWPCRAAVPPLLAGRPRDANRPAPPTRATRTAHTTDSERLTHCLTLQRVSLHCLHRPETGNPRSGHRAATRDPPAREGEPAVIKGDRRRSREIEGERAVIRQVDTTPGVNSILSRSSRARPARLSRARPRRAAHRRARRQRCSRSSAPSAGCCHA
jgi:hypothetical protein